jgi:hypothetical protein
VNGPNGPPITLIEPIDADLIREDPPNRRHQRSISELMNQRRSGNPRTLFEIEGAKSFGTNP